MNSEDKASFSFDFIWNKIVVPTSNKCIKLANAKHFECHFNSSIDKKNKFYDLFVKARENFKEMHHAEKQKGILSHCKLAAILTYTVIKEKLIQFDYNLKELDNANISKRDLIDCYLINYKNAFYCGLGMVYFGLIFDNLPSKKDKSNISENKSKNLNLLLKNNRVPIPSMCDGGDSLEEATVKALASDDLRGENPSISYLTIIMRLFKEYAIHYYNLSDVFTND